jgi:hypothetical protein
MQNPDVPMMLVLAVFSGFQIARLLLAVGWVEEQLT